MNDKTKNEESSTSTTNTDISFEAALNELERIVKALENNEVGLDNAVKYYEKASRLHAFCQQKLETAQLKVQSIIQKDGKITGITPTPELQDIYDK